MPDVSEKDMSHPDYKNIGSPAMRIIEECGEIIQAAMKGERFGWDNFHPKDMPDQTNLVSLNKELQDLILAIKDLENEIANNGVESA